MVFAVNSKEELEKFYQTFIKTCELSNRRGIKANQIVEIDFAEDKGLHYFWISDPAGNIVQLEYKVG